MIHTQDGYWGYCEGSCAIPDKVIQLTQDANNIIRLLESTELDNCSCENFNQCKWANKLVKVTSELNSTSSLRIKALKCDLVTGRLREQPVVSFLGKTVVISVSSVINVLVTKVISK